MAENKHTMSDLYQMQSLPLKAKIQMTKRRIEDWYNYWDGSVYVSFSGGKDSTVLADIVHNVCGLDDVPLVFVDTGLEYPEVREFVKGYGDEVVWLKPDMNFKQVILTKGYPFISKEISDCASLAKRGFKSGIDKLNGVDKNGNPSNFRKGFRKWKFLVDSPYDFSDECCWVNKKKPAKEYEKQTNRKPILGMMASESAFRKTAWLETGCNAFGSERPMSNPMSFWTEQDVLQYIVEHNLKIASVYGEIVEDIKNVDQLTLEIEGVKSSDTPSYKTTGCKRTGCIYCGFGCHLNNDERFTKLKESHPKQYEWIMKPIQDGGLGYKEVIDWLNQNGNLNIKY